MNDKMAQGFDELRTGAEATAKNVGAETANIGQIAAQDAESLFSRGGCRLLLLVAVLFAQEATVLVWERMKGKPPPQHRARVHS